MVIIVPKSKNESTKDTAPSSLTTCKESTRTQLANCNKSSMLVMELLLIQSQVITRLKAKANEQETALRVTTINLENTKYKHVAPDIPE